MIRALEPPSGSPVLALPARRDPPCRTPVGLDAAGVRLLLRALLFGGSSVPAWHDEAACADRPRSLYFAESDGVRLRAETVRAAKQVCRRCPVRAACLDDAMAHESPTHRHGVVGGLSPTERHRLHHALLGATS
jgi:WhiB family redox-sensing transcriptional regulator